MSSQEHCILAFEAKLAPKRSFCSFLLIFSLDFFHDCRGLWMLKSACIGLCCRYLLDQDSSKMDPRMVILSFCENRWIRFIFFFVWTKKTMNNQKLHILVLLKLLVSTNLGQGKPKGTKIWLFCLFFKMYSLDFLFFMYDAEQQEGLLKSLYIHWFLLRIPSCIAKFGVKSSSISSSLNHFVRFWGFGWR